MRFYLLAGGVLFLVPLIAGAQSISSIGDLSSLGGNSFSMAVSPLYPEPYSQPTISLTSTSIDLSNAIVTATVGGKQVYEGSANSFSVPVGAAGTETVVHATVSSEGSSYSQTLSVQPEDVIIIPEPIASIPPLYPGKPSVPLEGNVRLVAMANLKNESGSELDPNTYSYVWTVDGVEQIAGSGVEKSSIIVPSPLEYRESQISVVVTDPSGVLAGGDDLTYTAVSPTARIYEEDPLLGIRFDHALTGSYSINGAEDTLYAAPFNLPISSGAPGIQWYLNGDPVQTGTSVTLRPAGSGQGNADLSFTATGDNSTEATTNLSILFGTQSSNNLFGL
jgi:hypothetical protein